MKKNLQDLHSLTTNVNSRTMNKDYGLLNKLQHTRLQFGPPTNLDFWHLPFSSLWYFFGQPCCHMRCNERRLMNESCQSRSRASVEYLCSSTDDVIEDNARHVLGRNIHSRETCQSESFIILVPVS